MELQEFLKACSNTSIRESILLYRLVYELKLAAARAEYHLEVYLPTVDQDGFDIVVDDKEFIRKLQLKSVMSSAKEWKIHKTMLRPDFRACESLGFERSPVGCGTDGGVILAEVDARGEEMTVGYYYTDIYVITALRLGVVQRSAGDRNRAEEFCRDLGSSGVSHDRIVVPRSLFISVKTPDHILTLVGLHGRRGKYAWMNNLMAVAANEFRKPFPPEDDGTVRAMKR